MLVAQARPGPMINCDDWAPSAVCDRNGVASGGGAEEEAEGGGDAALPVFPGVPAEADARLDVVPVVRQALGPPAGGLGGGGEGVEGLDARVDFHVPAHAVVQG